MQINVTQEDIDRASQYLIQNKCVYSDKCPVALAITRERGTTSMVTKTEIIVGVKYWTPVGFATPPEVVDFIEKYDNSATRDQCRPFSFELK